MQWLYLNVILVEIKLPLTLRIHIIQVLVTLTLVRKDDTAPFTLLISIFIIALTFILVFNDLFIGFVFKHIHTVVDGRFPLDFEACFFVMFFGGGFVVEVDLDVLEVITYFLFTFDQHHN